MMITETPARPVPVCGHPVVQHAVRPRRDHHRARAAVGRAGRRARRAQRSSPRRRRRRVNDAQDAQPGKILHEMRDGEMAALGEIPFGRYYGIAPTPRRCSSCSPHAYFERTGDLPFIDRLWPHILAALDWMDRDGDPGPRRLHRVRAAQRDRARAAGLEGLVGLGVSRRRLAGRAADRAVRDPGLRVRGVARRGATGGRARRRRAGRALAARAATLQVTVRAGVLVRRSRHLRAGARRATSSRAASRTSNPGPLPVHRHREPGTRDRRRRHA